MNATIKRIALRVETALTGLPRRLDPETGIFTFTVRPTGPAGRSLRYTAITQETVGREYFEALEQLESR